MRIMIKGGLWKNTEDEILKAGVMKYGKNQWARISSLLVRKSATQCKARWYEWLDPSIKKIEWTREEDEKLMHLAKLMPSQWRTIAPIVGRTPSQCLERYEKLLDAVCAKDENYEPGDDPRKLRPGEIDPNPESKPARPDPVDMDADEKNLLSEAQARLANTRGKKAKRKAREKQLEEARRLASLQKRRELKAAGMDVQYRGRKMKGIDYNAEIPFEKRPPPGFYDVIDEDRPVEQPKFPTTIEELEGERRLDKEARLRKQDITRNKIAQREDPSEIMQACKLNDPETVKRRSKLKLPVPQIPDHELEAIAKNGRPSDVIGSEELADGNAATHALLASYAQTTKYARWNVGPVDENEKKMLSEARIRLANTRVKKAKRKAREKQLEEARRLASLLKRRELKAPGIDVRDRKRKGIDYKAEISFAKRRPLGFYDVVDEDRPVEQPKIPTTEELEGERSVDKESRMREHDIAQNKIAQRQDSPSAIMQVNKLNDLETVRRRRSKLNLPSPKGAHMRDKLHINEDMDILGRANLGQHNARNEFLVDLRNLPQPKNEFQIVMPPPPEDKEKSEAKIVEDMSDSIAKMKIEQEDRQQALLRKRSKVLQRELPRPPAGSLDLIRKSLLRADEDKSTVVPLTLIEQADEMVRKELLALLEHDIINYPLDEKAEKGEKHIKKSLYVPMQDDFTEEELKEADNLIAEEAQFLRLAMGHKDVTFDEFVDAQTSVNDIMTEFEKVKQMVADVTKKAEMREAKTKTPLQGYQNRAEKLWNQIQETSSKMNTAETELECFQALKIQEQLASSNRINCIREEVQKQKELERTLQTRYGDLLAERERIHKVKESYRVQEEEIVDSSDDGKQDPRRH